MCGWATDFGLQATFYEVKAVGLQAPPPETTLDPYVEYHFSGDGSDGNYAQSTVCFQTLDPIWEVSPSHLGATEQSLLPAGANRAGFFVRPEESSLRKHCGQSQKLSADCSRVCHSHDQILLFRSTTQIQRTFIFSGEKCRKHRRVAVVRQLAILWPDDWGSPL